MTFLSSNVSSKDSAVIPVFSFFESALKAALHWNSLVLPIPSLLQESEKISDHDIPSFMEQKNSFNRDTVRGLNATSGLDCFHSSVFFSFHH